MKTILWSLLLALLGVPAAAQIQTRISTFECSSSTKYTSSILEGVNNQGVVVGQCGQQGIIYANGIITHLTRMTNANGINSLGQVVGQDNGSGLLFSSGTYTNINYPGADVTVPFGINDLGTIVGIYQVGNQQHGFVYRNGAYTNFDYPGSASTLFRALTTADRWSEAFVTLPVRRRTDSW